MKQILRYAPTYYMLAICVAILGLTYYFMRHNDISQRNRVRRQARQAYESFQYQEATNAYALLMDSLKIEDNAALINHANANLLAINLHENLSAADSVKQRKVDLSLSEYGRLYHIGDATIASMSNSHTGFVALKSGNALMRNPTSIDSALRQAVFYFREALLRDPKNESARHNYELARKLLGYPDMVMQRTQSLVARRQYQKAVAYLKDAMRKDKRIAAAQKEYLTRLQQVASIDSLKQASSL